MTVCLAAIYNNSKIIALADKKLTITLGVTSAYELNENKKIVQLSPTCAALFAGNVTNASEVLAKVTSKIKTTDKVEDIAKKIIQTSTEVYNQSIESQLLGQFGLTLTTFNEQQKTLDTTFVNTIIQTISQQNLGIEILVVGMDNRTPKIFKIGLDNGLTDATSIGYAYIGSGGNHAGLSLIESDCHPDARAETILHSLVKAKRKAEFDPFVGEKSDIIMIGKSVSFIKDSVVKEIFITYDSQQDKIKAILEADSVILERILNGNPSEQ